LEQIRQALLQGIEVLKSDRPSTEDTRQHWSIEACFKLSSDRLSHPARELLMRLSIPPDGVSTDFVEPLTQMTVWQQWIRECVSLCLVDFDGKRYRFHPLIRQFASNVLCREERIRWQRHFVSFFLARVVDRQTDRARVSKEKDALLDIEWRNVLATIQLALDLDLRDQVADMPEYFSDFLLKRGLLEERRLLNENMVEAAEGRRDALNEGRNLVLLGRVLIDLGRWSEAVKNLLNAVRIVRRERNLATPYLVKIINHLESEAFLNISVAAARQRRWFAGMRAARISMAIPQSEIHRGESLTWLAHHRDNLGQFEKSGQNHEESIRLIRKNGSSYIGICDMHLGWHFLLRDELRAAEDILSRRAKECQGNQGMRATILLMLGEVRGKLGKEADATAHFKEAAQIADAIKDWSRRAEAFFKLAVLAYHQDDSRTAAQYKRRAQALLVRCRSEDVKLLDQVRSFQP